MCGGEKDKPTRDKLENKLLLKNEYWGVKWLVQYYTTHNVWDTKLGSKFGHLIEYL